VNESVWLTQQQMEDLFQTTKQNISLHLINIYKEGELDENSTVKDFLTVQKDGRRKINRLTAYYNRDAVISVGYPIKSSIATQFRIWATPSRSRNLRHQVFKFNLGQLKHKVLLTSFNRKLAPAIARADNASLVAQASCSCSLALVFNVK
jgi:hypothetical protein